MNLETRNCACGCGKTFKCLPSSQQKLAHRDKATGYKTINLSPFQLRKLGSQIRVAWTEDDTDKSK